MDCHVTTMAIKQFKILYPIIILYPVDVMYDFLFPKNAIQ